ncbi:RTA1-domain-containing protein [Mycena capillaripes]|nr:RTA1-domain-containing protein [Mycena capillaripes]
MTSNTSILFSRSGSMAVEDSQYGYIPHEYVGIIFVTLFGLSTILHVGQATYHRMWFLFPTACLCGLGELVGWSGRLWSAFSPSFSNPYMMQITSTIIAPTPLIAVNFILLTRIVERLGPCYSRLTPTWYTSLFLSFDIIALVIQGAGGGLAATAVTIPEVNLGANIMLAGIVFQFVSIILYSTFAADFLQWYHKDRPIRSTQSERGTMDAKLRTMIGALAFSTLVLFIRSIYRIIELATGWNGRILHTEVYFNVLDGGMVVLAIFTLNIAHPGRLLGPRPGVSEGGYVEKTQKDSRGSSTGTLMGQAV